MNILLNNNFHQRISSDHVGVYIHDYFRSTTTFMNHVRQRRHFGLVNTTFHFPTFEDKGRVHAYHNKDRMDYRRENLLQACLNEFAVAVIGRDSVIIDLAYSFAGLVTITQSHLVHYMLQGVEHTDSTEWSNSHLLHWRKIRTGCSITSQSFQELFTISFQRSLGHSCEGGSATFYIIKFTEHV